MSSLLNHNSINRNVSFQKQSIKYFNSIQFLEWHSTISSVYIKTVTLKIYELCCSSVDYNSPGPTQNGNKYNETKLLQSKYL